MSETMPTTEKLALLLSTSAALVATARTPIEQAQTIITVSTRLFDLVDQLDNALRADLRQAGMQDLSAVVDGKAQVKRGLFQLQRVFGAVAAAASRRTTA